jgi:hypothetical protein
LRWVLCLLGCSAAQPPPSGEPVSLAKHGADFCANHLVEGSLLADVKLPSHRTGATQNNSTVVELWPLDAVVWPSFGEPARFEAVFWPMDFAGVRLAGGAVAVVDGAGNLIAVTGRKYRLKGEWVGLSSIGGSDFPSTWIEGFYACGAIPL